MESKAEPGVPGAADRDWFAEQVNGLVPQLFGAAVRLCRNRMDAEDLVADAVAKAWSSLSSLEDRGAFRAWIFRILNNQFVSNCRSPGARAIHEPIEAPEREPFSLFERLHQPILLWWGNPEQDFLNGLLREDLERALDALADPFRIVVVMVDLEGLSYLDVAGHLEIPIGTVRSRLARGRGLLQKALWEHAADAGLIPHAGRKETRGNNER